MSEEPFPRSATYALKAAADMASGSVLGAVHGAATGMSLGKDAAALLRNPITVVGGAVGAIGGMVVGGAAGLVKGFAAALEEAPEEPPPSDS